MTQDSLVSIIIPTYNCRRWLGEAIDSALKQTYRHCEIIVVDDGSTDGTGDWVQGQYGERIRYHWQPNGGVARARNTGLGLAQGAYIQWLDADDRIAPEKIATHVAYLEQHPECAAVYCHTLQFNAVQPEEMWDFAGKTHYVSGNILPHLLDNGFILPAATLVRCEWALRAAPFDESLPSNEDWDYWLRMAHAGARFHHLPERPLAFYRVHSASRSSHHVEHGRSGIIVLQKLERAISDPGERKRLRIGRAVGRWRFAYGKALVESGELAQGWWQMARSLLADQRDLDYKLSYMALVLLVGPEKAVDTQGRLKRAKDHLIARPATEVSS